LAGLLISNPPPGRSPPRAYGTATKFGIFDQLIREWSSRPVRSPNNLKRHVWPWNCREHHVRPAMCRVSAATPSLAAMNGATSGALDSRPNHATASPTKWPVLGYQVNTCNRLRLWRAESHRELRFYAFNNRDTTEEGARSRRKVTIGDLSHKVHLYAANERQPPEGPAPAASSSSSTSF